jgi:hypothetical protein
MPEKPWSQDFIEGLVRCLAILVECADLDDAESDRVTALLFSKLRQNSGIPSAQFDAAVSATCTELRHEATILEAASLSRH